MSRCTVSKLLAVLVLSFSALPAPSGGDEPRGRWELVRQVSLDDQVWAWNSSSWDQEKIATFGRFQYTIYWDADRVLVLVRRDLGDESVQMLRLPQFTLTSDDAHRNTCLGISAGDGRLHLSWDHHNNPLRYARSRAGFLTDPPPQISAADIGPAEAIGGGEVPTSRATYPRFLHAPGGGLSLFYRQGGSGNGDNYLLGYQPDGGSWKAVGQLFSARGVYEPWENSRSRNAYFHDLLFDAEGRLHATWVYREIAQTWASNHDLHYAYSDDGGSTWHNNAGQKIADAAEGDPIELADPGIVVRRIPVYSWLMNAGCMALDSQRRPHVITFMLPEPKHPETLRHDPTPEIRQGLRYVHFWRDDDGRWQGGEPIEAGPRDGNVARGDAVFDAEDRLYFFYPDRLNGGLQCLEAPATGGWRTWQSYPLTGREISSRDATKHDRRRWAEEGILSFTAKLGEHGLGIVELRPAATVCLQPRAAGR